MRARLGLLLFLLSINFTIRAQDYIDLAKLHYSNTPVNPFDTLTSGTRVQEWGIDLTLPVQLNEKYTLITGLYAEEISTKTAPIESNLTSVYTTLVKAGVSIKHSNRLSASYILLPKLSSDFKSLGPEDFQLGAIALFKLKKNKNFFWKFGLYYNDELFGPFFVPILGFYHLSENKKLELNIGLPLSADVNYKVHKELALGIRFEGFVRTFHLNEPSNGNADNYLQKQCNELFAYAQWQTQSNLLFQFRVGYSIGRNYRVYDQKDQIKWGLAAFRFGDDRDQLNSDFSDGIIFQARVFYRFPIKS